MHVTVHLLSVLGTASIKAASWYIPGTRQPLGTIFPKDLSDAPFQVLRQGTMARRHQPVLVGVPTGM